MKTQLHGRQKRFAVTLVELLWVVCVIGVLVALLLPLISHRDRPGRPYKIKTKVEMADLANAINAYETEYNQFPLADSGTNEDVTCGINSTDKKNSTKVDGTRLITTNSDLMIVLMDFDFGINASHKLNPKQIKFLNARVVEDTNSSGVSMIDHQYRDPWGSPYVITVDVTHDDQCSDFLYCQQHVSQSANNSQAGLNGLFNAVETNGSGNHFYYHGKVMVWSAGPDKKFDLTVPANAGVNRDNILSWQ